MQSYENNLNLTKQLLIGKETALLLSDKNQTQITIPNFKDNSSIIEEMTMLEAQMQSHIDKTKELREKEGESLIKELISIIQIIMKEKKKENNEIKHIEFDKLKEIHNSYRNTVSILDTAKARILDITHELIERDGKCPKNKTQPKIGRPPKVKVLNKMNNKNIDEYFIKQN